MITAILSCGLFGLGVVLLAMHRLRVLHLRECRRWQSLPAGTAINASHLAKQLVSLRADDLFLSSKFVTHASWTTFQRLDLARKTLLKLRYFRVRRPG